MPNPPPKWDQYYPGGPQQQAADWNASQHDQIYQDPGTHAGPIGPTGPTGIIGPTGITGPTGSLGPTGTVLSGSNQASFCASNTVNTSLTPQDTIIPFTIGGGNTFQKGNYFNNINHNWTPPVGVVLLQAQCL